MIYENTYKFEGEYAYIILPKGEVKINLSDYELIKPYYWYITKYGHVESATLRHSEGKQLRLDRFLTGCSKDKIVKHLNNNTLDNTRNNLEITTTKELNKNSRGRKINTKPRYKGISYCKATNKWSATIKKNGETISLGYFNTQQEAFKEYLDYTKKEYENFDFFHLTTSK